MQRKRPLNESLNTVTNSLGQESSSTLQRPSKELLPTKETL